MFNMQLCTKNCLQQSPVFPGLGRAEFPPPWAGLADTPASHGEFPQLQLFPRGLRFGLHQLLRGAALARAFLPGLWAMPPCFHPDPQLQKGGISSI